MKKGEGGTIGVGKRGGGSPLENRNGGVPFNDSFHRPGDQSLTKNIYFPRQLNGYHMDAFFSGSSGNSDPQQTPSKSSKKTLIERTLNKFSSTGISTKNKKQIQPAKESPKQHFVPYPVSQVDGRWLYQPPQYVYHQRQFNHSAYDPHQQFLHHKSSRSSSPYHSAWSPSYSYSPETPPVDYDFPYDRYRGGGAVCSHIDKYGTQRGSKYIGRSRKECKKCRSEGFSEDNSNYARTKNILRSFDEKHPILGSPQIPKYPYNYRYSRSDEDIDDEWSSYWEKEEESEESDTLPLQKLFLESNYTKTKDSSDTSNLSTSKSPYLISSTSTSAQNNLSKSFNSTKSDKFSQSNNKKPQLATFASIKDNKVAEIPGDNPFPKTGIIIVEDDVNVGRDLQKEVKHIRPFEEESTSSDSSTSSNEEGFVVEENIQSHSSAQKSQTTWSKTANSCNNTSLQSRHLDGIKNISADDQKVNHDLKENSSDCVKQDLRSARSDSKDQSIEIVDSFEVSKPRLVNSNLNGQRRLNKLNNHKLYHRKYQSRHYRGRKKNPSTQIIDEVILEEDEDALEAENLEVISATPPIKVKSILKSKHPSLEEQNFSNKGVESSCTLNGDSDGKSDQNCASDNIQDKTTAIVSDGKNISKSDTKINPSTDSIENNEEHIEDDSEQTEKSDSDDSMKKFRRKGVSFHSLSGNFKSEKKENVRPAPLLNRQEKVEMSSSEDELQGYSTVIVSQNLTDEILSEIYGETGTNNEKGINKTPSEDEHQYEEFSSKNCVAVNGTPGKQNDSKLKPNFKIGDNTSPSNSCLNHETSSHAKIHTDVGSFEPKSLADEILDEVYGHCPGSNDKSESTKKSDKSSSEDEDGEYETIGEFRESRTSNPNMTKNFKHNTSNIEVPKRGFAMNVNGIGNFSKSSDITNKTDHLHNPALIVLARRFHSTNTINGTPSQRKGNDYRTKNSSGDSPMATESKRQGRKQRHSMSSLGPQLSSHNFEQSRGSNVQPFNHSLFNDTTRLRKPPKRPSLSNIFSHEEPLPNNRSSQNKPVIRFFSPCRPKEPPPPPPPVASVLAPITPPKQFSPFELKRINLVINGGEHIKDKNSQQSTEHVNSKKRHALYDTKHETIQEEEDDDINDEFSTDEFSEDEFGTDEEEKLEKSNQVEAITDNLEQTLSSKNNMITYQNIKDIDKHNKLIHSDNSTQNQNCLSKNVPKTSLKDICSSKNKNKHIYDDVNTDVGIEEDSLEEKLSFSEEYETEGDFDDNMASPKSILRSCSLSNKSNSCSKGSSDMKIIDSTKVSNYSKKIEDSLIEKSGDKMIIFTSAAVQASSSNQDKRRNISSADVKKINFSNKNCALDNKQSKTHSSTSSVSSISHGIYKECQNYDDEEETFVDQQYPAITTTASHLTKSDNALSNSTAIKSDHQILISSSSFVDVKGISSTSAGRCSKLSSISLQKTHNNSTVTAENNHNFIQRKDHYENKKGVLFEINSIEQNDESKTEGLVDVNTISINKRAQVNGSHSHYFNGINGYCGELSSDVGFTLDSLEPIKPPRKKKMAKLQKEQYGQCLISSEGVKEPIYPESAKRSISYDSSNANQSHYEEKKSDHSTEMKMNKSHSQKVISHSIKNRTAESRQRRPNISAPILLDTTLNPNDLDAHQSISQSSSTFDPETLIHELQNNLQEHGTHRISSKHRNLHSVISQNSDTSAQNSRYQNNRLSKNNTHKYYRSHSNPQNDQITSFFNDHPNLSRKSTNSKKAEQISAPLNTGSVSHNATNGDRLTFDDLKRYAKSSINSALSNAGFNRQFSSELTDKNERSDNPGNQNSRNKHHKKTGRSKFYETDNLRETLYIEDSALMKSDVQRQQTTSPYPSSEHIYEEIEECNKIRNTMTRPLPPIPEGSKRKFGKSEMQNIAEASNWKEGIAERQRSGSIFEGASKYDILDYLNNAKDRLNNSEFEIEKEDPLNSENSTVPGAIVKGSDDDFSNDTLERKIVSKRKSKSHRISSISNASDCSTTSASSGNSQYSAGSLDEANGSALLGDSTMCQNNVLNIQDASPINPVTTCGIGKSGWVEIERADSGVGSESSKTSKASIELRRAASMSKSSDSGSSDSATDHQEPFTLVHSIKDNHTLCQDCDMICDSNQVNNVCKKCGHRRAERKEIITEIVETEVKYGKDLRIIVEEFYRPMLVAGLLTSELLATIFLNVDELIQVNNKFAKMLKDAVNSTLEQGEEDFQSIRIGAIFLESIGMLRAFESYCTRQGSASLILTTLEREKELLRVFLKVSQMENCMLRRMNLSSFLMVPVQRVTKYPLLLSRLYKVTPHQHEDRPCIKRAKEKIESALEQMNKDAKDLNTVKLWRRLPMMTSSNSNSPSKKSEGSSQDEISMIKLKKMALEILGWNEEETRFPLGGRILFTQPNEGNSISNWKKSWTAKLGPIHALLAVLSSEDLPEVSSKKQLIFPSNTSSIKDASLVIVREKNAKNSPIRDPLSLERCIICCEQDWDDCFEIQEFVSKEQFIFKGEESGDTEMWFKTLQFYTQCLGGWRKRRKALGNIMIDPNVSSAMSDLTISDGDDNSASAEGACALPTSDD